MSDEKKADPSAIEPPPPLPRLAVDALNEDVQAALASRSDEWDGFTAAVWARIDGTDALGEASLAWPTIVSALKADHAASISDFEARHGEFAEGFALRRAEHDEDQSATVGEVLRQEVETEVAERDGVWAAFHAQVMHRIEEHEHGAVGLADDARVVLRGEVDAELDAMASRFDGEFLDGVERQLFPPAQKPDPWWQRLGESFNDWLRPSPAWGLAAAAAVAAVFVLVRPSPTPEVPADDGRVSISAVRFDGTVTVMADEGIALVWVTDDAS